MNARLAAMIAARVFGRVVVFVAFAAAISEGSANVGFVVIEPALKVASAWARLHRLFARSCIQSKKSEKFFLFCLVMTRLTYAFVDGA